MLSTRTTVVVATSVMLGGLVMSLSLLVVATSSMQVGGSRVVVDSDRVVVVAAVSQSVDLGQKNTTPTKDYENVRVVVYLRGVQRGCTEEGERGSTPTG